MQNKKNKTRKLTQMALLTAIILLMAFTPLGYLRTGVVEITFIMIPVVVGAILMGPCAGAILGGVFGLTSFIQCFGMSALGAMLLQVNWFFTFVVCFVPRVLMGWLAGLIFKALYKVDKTRLVSFAVASLSGAVLNTIFFVGSLGLLFYNTVLGMASESGISVLAFLLSFVTLNSVLECAACLIVGTAISKALYKSFGSIKEQ
ncbi:MAG: ECF transporter S component [Clostridiales bacterium]|nr:ECF transporter S component [Clostridiales bacterium]